MVVDGDERPPHFMEVFSNTLPIAVAPAWADWLWKAGLKEELIVQHTTLLGQVKLASLKTHIVAVEGWRVLIQNAILDGTFTTKEM